MNFDWKNLRKEQKQAAILIGMWIFGSLFALYQFLLLPFLQTHGAPGDELDKLHSDIQKAEVAMDEESRLRTDYAEGMRSLQEASERYIVPMDNPLSWVTERIYASARLVGVDVQSVAEMTGTSAVWDNMIKTGRAFRPYAVRVSADCSYEEVLALVRVLEEGNPYICVSGVLVAGVEQRVEKHSIGLTVEWPMWGRHVEFEVAKRAKKASAAKEAEKGKGRPGAKPGAAEEREVKDGAI